MMEPMIVNSERSFKQQFTQLISDSTRFLDQDGDASEFDFSNGEIGVLEILLKINGLCSTKRGVLSPTPISRRLKVVFVL